MTSIWKYLAVATGSLVTSAMIATSVWGAPPAWEITDADSRIVLFPTIHVLPDGLDWETDRLKAEIAQADEVWFEIADATSPEALAKIQTLVADKGLSPDTPLSQQLSAEQLAELEAALEGLGVPLQAIDPMRPWMAATALTAASLAQSGFSPDAGVEKALDDDYGDRPRRGLESADFQIAMLASLGGEDQIGFLMSALDGLEDAGPTLLRVADGWAQGDVDVIETELLAEMRRDYPEVFQAVFTDRNANWADIIVEELSGSGTDFIAVGAGHLVGEGSVQHMLAERGYSVRRISLAD